MTEPHTSKLRSKTIRFEASKDGRLIHDDDFEYDAILRVDGDFASDEQRKSYADWLCSKLNAIKHTPELANEQCDDAIRASGLWTLALAVPQNLTMLRGLCRAATEAAQAPAASQSRRCPCATDCFCP
jgi:hypothetical protein